MEQPKLLIADSGDEFRQALAGVLGDEYQIRTCRSGIQALELLRAFRPDILVTDLMLTELDGPCCRWRSRRISVPKSW